MSGRCRHSPPIPAAGRSPKRTTPPILRLLRRSPTVRSRTQHFPHLRRGGHQSSSLWPAASQIGKTRPVRGAAMGSKDSPQDSIVPPLRKAAHALGNPACDDAQNPWSNQADEIALDEIALEDGRGRPDTEAKLGHRPKVGPPTRSTLRRARGGVGTGRLKSFDGNRPKPHAGLFRPGSKASWNRDAAWHWPAAGHPLAGRAGCSAFAAPGGRHRSRWWLLRATPAFQSETTPGRGFLADHILPYRQSPRQRKSRSLQSVSGKQGSQGRGHLQSGPWNRGAAARAVST
jgi:hypothetical protein